MADTDIYDRIKTDNLLFVSSKVKQSIGQFV